MTPEEELSRANECSQILGNKYVKDALQSIKDALVEQWRVTPVENVSLREKIWGIYNGAIKFEEILTSHIQTGNMVRIDEERKRTLAERLKNWAA